MPRAPANVVCVKIFTENRRKKQERESIWKNKIPSIIAFCPRMKIYSSIMSKSWIFSRWRWKNRWRWATSDFDKQVNSKCERKSIKWISNRKIINHLTRRPKWKPEEGKKGSRKKWIKKTVKKVKKKIVWIRLRDEFIAKSNLRHQSSIDRAQVDDESSLEENLN